MGTNKSAKQLQKMRDELQSVWMEPWRRFDEFVRGGEWRPVVRIEECADAGTLTIRAEIPGVEKLEDIDVEFLDGTLTITATRHDAHEETGEHFHRSEFRYGQVSRAVPIPRGVDPSSVEATYTNGVLQVRLRVPEHVDATSGPRRVAVRAG